MNGCFLGGSSPLYVFVSVLRQWLYYQLQTSNACFANSGVERHVTLDRPLSILLDPFGAIS